MTGLGGAFPGLGQAGAGIARGTARGLCSPVGASSTGPSVLPSPRKPGLAGAERRRSLADARAAVERRQASVPPPNPPPQAGEGKEKGCAPHREMRRLGPRLSAFRFPFLFSQFVGRMKRSVIRGSSIRSCDARSRFRFAPSGLRILVVVSKTRARIRVARTPHVVPLPLRRGAERAQRTR